MYNRVEYTDNRTGLRTTTHVVGNTTDEVVERVHSLFAANRGDLEIHVIEPEQPDFMQHEFDALSKSIGNDGNGTEAMIVQMIGDILRTIREISRTQTGILSELRRITGQIDSRSTD